MSPRRRANSVVLTQRALTDLREIERYSVNEWGRKAAEKYMSAFAAALDRLQESPEILRLELDFAPGLYFYRVNRHILVCDFQEESVLVLTVIHSSMDLPVRLQELEPRLVAEVKILRAKLHEDPSHD
ncbi:MAG: type II toxin-antitoxin system RelE/ParE family toxin [Planctomycetales bacterium]